jgi:hypothetical protein
MILLKNIDILSQDKITLYLESEGHMNSDWYSAYLAATGENDPVLFYAVQEYLHKDGFIAKPHRAVETM